MAELADALGSGLSERKLVRVQVPPSAPQSTAFGGETDSLKGEFFVIPLIPNSPQFLQIWEGLGGRHEASGGVVRVV